MILSSAVGVLLAALRRFARLVQRDVEELLVQATASPGEMIHHQCYGRELGLDGENRYRKGSRVEEVPRASFEERRLVAERKLEEIERHQERLEEQERGLEELAALYREKAREGLDLYTPPGIDTTPTVRLASTSYRTRTARSSSPGAFRVLVVIKSV